VEVRFCPHPDERFYGLGQHRHGKLNQKGAVIDLVQRNNEVAIPWLLSSRGYGFLWNNPALDRVELATTGTRWVAEATREIDYWVTTGDTPAEIMAHYADATGHAPMLPEWAAGFWQSRLRYRTQSEVLDVTREYRRRGLPLSVIVIDFFHWPMQGCWDFDPACWPDPEAMVRELEQMGIKVMVSVWPSVNGNSPNFEFMRKRGYLLRTERGVSAIFPFMDTQPEGLVYIHYYDPSRPEARRFVWERCRDHYYRRGIKVFWLDACEPEMDPPDHGNLRYHIGNGREVGALYPFLHQQTFYEGLKAEGEQEIIMLCRSAWPGSQRFGAAVWSGDIESHFDVLRTQVPAGLNIGLSGIPWWTTDIGGFKEGDPRTAEFRELLVRWFQYGTFCPLFCLHGNRLPTDGKYGAPNEVWSFGEDVYAILKRYLFVRERLRPYILQQMDHAHVQGIPPMRPLFFDFPDDPGSWEIDDEFMFGPDLLVAPILEKGARRRQVYLPPASFWTDAWTGVKYKGGSCVEAPAPLDIIPVYLREGSALPVREGTF